MRRPITLRTPLEAAASVIGGKENMNHKSDNYSPSEFGFRPVNPRGPNTLTPSIISLPTLVRSPGQDDVRQAMSIGRIVHPDREDAVGGPKAPIEIEDDDEAWDEKDHDRMSDKLNEAMCDHFAMVGSASGVAGTLAFVAKKEAKKINWEKSNGWFKRIGKK